MVEIGFAQFGRKYRAITYHLVSVDGESAARRLTRKRMNNWDQSFPLICNRSLADQEEEGGRAACGLEFGEQIKAVRSC